MQQARRTTLNDVELESLRAVADCTSPRGPYETTLHSTLGGRSVFAQTFPDGSWYLAYTEPVESDSSPLGSERSSEGRSAELTMEMREMARGHDFHYMALYPESRYRPAGSPRIGELDGKPAIVIPFEDSLGGEVLWYGTPDDLLPLGARLPDHLGGEPDGVSIRFDDWAEVQGVRLFRKTRIRHAGSLFEFDYRTLEIDSPLPSPFPVTDWQPSPDD